jgi:hypothetical protein
LNEEKSKHVSAKWFWPSIFARDADKAGKRNSKTLTPAGERHSKALPAAVDWVLV